MGPTNTVRRVVCKDEPIKDERPRTYCKIDALHSHHSASVTSLGFLLVFFFLFDWRKEEQNVRFYKKKKEEKQKASTAYTPVAYHHLSRKKKTTKKILFRRELFWTLELSSFLHSGAR